MHSHIQFKHIIQGISSVEALKLCICLVIRIHIKDFGVKVTIIIRKLLSFRIP